MTTALKILLSLSFGMPIVAAAMAISWGIQEEEKLSIRERDRTEFVVTENPAASTGIYSLGF